jgi:hypothetical protein
VHTCLKVVFVDDPPGEIHPLGALTLVADADFELVLVEYKDHFDQLRGLAVITMIDRVVDGLADGQLEIFDPIGRQPDRLADLIGARAYDALEDRV